jgi:acyl-CoA dehydrogenase
MLDWLLTDGDFEQQTPIESIRDWKSCYDKNAERWQEPVDRAISGGYKADRTAHAFLAGFFSALQRLLPELPKEHITAFCISEEGGAHPRAIKTRLEKMDSPDPNGNAWRLNGRKQFITCANDADSILVAASTGTDTEGRNRIRLAHIDRNSAGVKIEPMPDLPFIPEIRHGVVFLEDVAVSDSQLLEGDAYLAYIKPFRTVEDIHVSAAILGYLLRCAVLFQWPLTTRESLLGLIAAIRPLAMADPLAPSIHIAYAGLQRSMGLIVSDLDQYWKNAPDADKKAWERDRAVMGIARKANTIRLKSAWKTSTASQPVTPGSTPG